MAAVGHFVYHKLVSHKRHDAPVQLTIAVLAGALAGGAGIEEVLTKLTLTSLALVPSADYAKISIIDNNGLFSLAATSQLAIPIDDSKGDPVEQVLEQTRGRGADKGCECVGYQAHDPQGHENSAMTMNRLVDSVRFTGHIGVVGIFLPQDPNAPDKLEQEGKIAFDMGKFWFKGQKVGTGQANVKHYNRQLRDLIHEGRAKPSWIVSHELPLDEAPSGYQHFDARDDGWTKVVLHP
jgi:threonine dehydrogenase-like Zn-dependent dehydrogenase